ncbi:hypothetical protein L4D76_19530, partial [Photobacterium sagamiensis]|uniref:hypothetical protein n=1 Tax=Photobacterium sagamiensis TaxID=2910241 RepID=UPI003D147172
MDIDTKEKLNEVITTERKRLAQFEHNYKGDKKNGIQRYSNSLLKTFESLDSHALRMYKFTSDSLNLYPMDLLENESFIKALESGEEYLPLKYRSVTLKASDYTDRYYPTQKNNGPRHFLQHAIKLWDASLIKTMEDPASSNLVALLGKRIITDVAFVVESKDGKKKDVKLTI